MTVRKTFYGLIGIASVPALALYLVAPVPVDFPFPEDKVWKHRQNNPADALNAATTGSAGIEMDIWFDGNQLRAAHDTGEVAESEAVSVHFQKFKTLKTKPSIWFDLKNLSLSNENDIRAEILSLMKTYDLHDRLLVESPWPTRMFRLCKQPVHCSVWVQNADSPVWRVWSRITTTALSRWGNLASVSIDYRHTSHASKIVPDSFPKLIYTFPAGADLQAFKPRNDYKILLTD